MVEWLDIFIFILNTRQAAEVLLSCWCSLSSCVPKSDSERERQKKPEEWRIDLWEWRMCLCFLSKFTTKHNWLCIASSRKFYSGFCIEVTHTIEQIAQMLATFFILNAKFNDLYCSMYLNSTIDSWGEMFCSHWMANFYPEWAIWNPIT